MKKSLCLLFFLIVSCSSHKQLSHRTDFVRVDYHKIESEISDTNSRFYYPNLFKRLKSLDTTLTTDDYFHLYYGYTCQDNYQPYYTPRYIQDYNKYVNGDNSSGTNDSILKYSLLILEDNPFMLKFYSMVGYGYNNKGNHIEQLKYYKIQWGLMDAILSTGDGLTEESSMHVIYVSNEYDILMILGLKFGGQQGLTKFGNDALTVENNDYNIDEFFFNVSRLFEINRKRMKKY